MRVAIFGATGMLGQALIREFKTAELIPLSSKDADLRVPAQVENALRSSRPDWTILCAAYTDVDGCESNRDLAFAINCTGAVNVALAARAVGSRLAFISTDYVFDGGKGSPYEAGDIRHPINVYGESKACAEERLLEILPDACIVRTSWLFGPGGKCFPDTMVKLASTRAEISVVNDQRGSPTLTSDLASALEQLCVSAARGIVHVTNAGNCTWYEFAKEIVALAGLPTQIRPITSAEFPRPARRPRYSVLSPASAHALGIVLPEWRDGLRRYFEAIRIRDGRPLP